MPLKDKQKNAITRWMKDHGVRTDCPACGAQAGWEIHDAVIVGLDVDLESKQAKPSSAGFFALACKNCRYVMLFAAAPILGK